MFVQDRLSSWALQELAHPDGSPTDVDREFVAMYWVAHERMTFYAGKHKGSVCCAHAAQAVSASLTVGKKFLCSPCNLSWTCRPTLSYHLSEMPPVPAEDNIKEFLPGAAPPGSAIDPSNTTAAAGAALHDTLTDEADPSSEADHFYGINGAREPHQ